MFSKSSISAGSIMLAVALMPASVMVAHPAFAQTSISVSLQTGTFYDRLSPYGEWVSFKGTYVFVPARVSYGWRPYSLGHWVYTRDYGWLWVSNEPFGWATYHYGRWGFSPDIGWYWVPGHRWAPAWVAWSRSNGDIAWAPLPPSYDDQASVTFAYNDVPDNYWQAVPTGAFLSIDLSSHFLRDNTRVHDVVRQGTPEAVKVQNNIVVNNVIPVGDIERATHTKVKVLETTPASSPDAAGKSNGNGIAVFNPEVKADSNAKPKSTVTVDQVAKQHGSNGSQIQDVPAVPSNSQIKDQNGNAVPTINPPAQKGGTLKKQPLPNNTAQPDTTGNGNSNGLVPDANTKKLKHQDQGNGQPGAPPDLAIQKKGQPLGSQIPAQPAPMKQPGPKVLNNNAVPSAPGVDVKKHQNNANIPVPGNAAPQPKQGKDKKSACDPNTEQCPQ